MQSISGDLKEARAPATRKKTWRISQHSLSCLSVLCLLMAAMMAIQHRADLLGLPMPPVVRLIEFCGGVAMLMWMRTDARLRGSPIPGGGLLAAAVLLPLAIPGYILWTRRWWGAFAIFICLVALLAAAIVGESVARRALGVPMFVM